jgi:hypothetical protein
MDPRFSPPESREVIRDPFDDLYQGMKNQKRKKENK